MTEQRKLALITGASSGLGKVIAELFAKDGHNVALVARRQDRLEEWAAHLRTTHNVEARVIPSDLSNPDAAGAIQAALEGQPVEFLVNNAGFGTNGPFVELPLKRELDQIQVNITSLTELCHRFGSKMADRGHGRILNIASTAGFQPGPWMSTYCATKAYVLHFSEGLASELSGRGVTVTAHCPGATSTEFQDIAGNADAALFKAGLVATAENVAGHAYRSMMRGQAVAVHGKLNSAIAFTTRLVPRVFTRWAASKALERRP